MKEKKAESEVAMEMHALSTRGLGPAGTACILMIVGRQAAALFAAEVLVTCVCVF